MASRARTTPSTELSRSRIRPQSCPAQVRVTPECPARPAARRPVYLGRGTSGNLPSKTSTHPPPSRPEFLPYQRRLRWRLRSPRPKERDPHRPTHPAPPTVCPLGNVVLRPDPDCLPTAPQLLLRFAFTSCKACSPAPPQDAQCTLGAVVFVRSGGWPVGRRRTAETEPSYPIGRRPQYASAQFVVAW